jgi:hypothetical protein
MSLTEFDFSHYLFEGRKVLAIHTCIRPKPSWSCSRTSKRLLIRTRVCENPAILYAKTNNILQRYREARIHMTLHSLVTERERAMLLRTNRVCARVKGHIHYTLDYLHKHYQFSKILKGLLIYGYKQFISLSVDSARDRSKISISDCNRVSSMIEMLKSSRPMLGSASDVC